MRFTDEEREAVIDGLGALMRRLRDAARPRAERRQSYSPEAARQYYLAEDLIDRIWRGD